MSFQSIILKGDDQRVQPAEVHSLLGKKPARRATDGQPAPQSEEEACETRVEVLRVDNEVRGIEVHCSCGEVTVVELSYPSSGQPSSNEPGPA